MKYKSGLSLLFVCVMTLAIAPPVSGAPGSNLQLYILPLECSLDTVAFGQFTSQIITPQDCLPPALLPELPASFSSIPDKAPPQLNLPLRELAPLPSPLILEKLQMADEISAKDREDAGIIPIYTSILLFAAFVAVIYLVSAYMKVLLLLIHRLHRIKFRFPWSKK